jgi:hypothetical protein
LKSEIKAGLSLKAGGWAVDWEYVILLVSSQDAQQLRAAGKAGEFFAVPGRASGAGSPTAEQGGMDMPARSPWKRRGAGLALAIVIACSTALALRWVFLVPIFQAPDEPTHFDYALALNEHRGLLRAPTGTGWSEMVHPHTAYLSARARLLDLKENPGYAYVSPDYGSRAYFDALDRDAPPRPPRDAVLSPGIARVYPFGYYAVLAVWMEGVRRVAGDGPVRLFLGARCFSAFLLAVSLFFSYRTLREIGARRRLALLLAACIGCFPLVSFVASYVQPDNLALTLTSAGFYFGLRLRRQPGRGSLQAVLGLILGGLAVTKMHFALCLMLPLSAMLASAWLTRPPGWRGALRCAALLALPSALLLLAHLWVTARSANHLYVPAPNPGGPAYVTTLKRFTAAFTDYFMGSTHVSFWGCFGWLTVPLVIGDRNTHFATDFVVQVFTWVVLALTLVRMEQVGARLFRAARRGHPRRACQIACSHLPVNSLFLFTVLMFVLHVRTANGFGAQGRNWVPFLLPMFWLGVVYAPAGLRLRAARSLTAAGYAGLLLFFATVGSGYALHALRDSFYCPPQKAERSSRETVLVRCPLGPAGKCRPLALEGSRESPLVCPLDRFEAVEVLVSGAPADGTKAASRLTLRLLDEAGNTLAAAGADLLPSETPVYLQFPLRSPAGLRGRPLRLVLSREGGKGRGVVAVWAAGDKGQWATRLLYREPGFPLDCRGVVHSIEVPTLAGHMIPVALAGAPIEFTPTCPFEHLQGVDLFLATAGRTSSGRLLLEVEDCQGRLLGSAEVNAAYLDDNSWRWFPLPHISGVAGQRLRLRLSYLPAPGETATPLAWRSGTDPSVLLNHLVTK